MLLYFTLESTFCAVYLLVFYYNLIDELIDRLVEVSMFFVVTEKRDYQ